MIQFGMVEHKAEFLKEPIGNLRRLALDQLYRLIRQNLIYDMGKQCTPYTSTPQIRVGQNPADPAYLTLPNEVVATGTSHFTRVLSYEIRIAIGGQESSIRIDFILSE